MTRVRNLSLLLFAAGCLTAQQTVQYGYDAAGRLISANYGDGNAITYTYDAAGNLLRREVTSGQAFVSVSSASFAPGQALAAEVIAAGFGPGLATGTAGAPGTPLPTELLGTSVDVTDSQGVTRAAPLFFVSAGQINYLIPGGTAPGLATVRVNSGTGAVIEGTIQIDAVAPSVYSANSQGTGVAAAFFLRVNPDNSRTQDLLFNPATGASVPLDISPQNGPVFLLLFGSGFRGFQNEVTATVGGQSVPVLGAVPQGEFVGLDQINIGPLPAILGASGESGIVLTADGKTANTITVNIQ